MRASDSRGTLRILIASCDPAGIVIRCREQTCGIAIPAQEWSVGGSTLLSGIKASQTLDMSVPAAENARKVFRSRFSWRTWQPHFPSRHLPDRWCKRPNCRAKCRAVLFTLVVNGSHRDYHLVHFECLHQFLISFAGAAVTTCDRCSHQVPQRLISARPRPSASVLWPREECRRDTESAA